MFLTFVQRMFINRPPSVLEENTCRAADWPAERMNTEGSPNARSRPLSSPSIAFRSSVCLSSVGTSTYTGHSGYKKDQIEGGGAIIQEEEPAYPNRPDFCVEDAALPLLFHISSPFYGCCFFRICGQVQLIHGCRKRGGALSRIFLETSNQQIK